MEKMETWGLMENLEKLETEKWKNGKCTKMEKRKNGKMETK